MIGFGCSLECMDSASENEFVFESTTKRKRRLKRRVSSATASSSDYSGSRSFESLKANPKRVLVDETEEEDRSNVKLFGRVFGSNIEHHCDGVDAMMQAPLSVKHLVWQTPDKQRSVCYNLQTLKQIKNYGSNFSWKQPPLFKDPATEETLGILSNFFGLNIQLHEDLRIDITSDLFIAYTLKLGLTDAYVCPICFVCFYLKLSQDLPGQGYDDLHSIDPLSFVTEVFRYQKHVIEHIKTTHDHIQHITPKKLKQIGLNSFKLRDTDCLIQKYMYKKHHRTKTSPKPSYQVSDYWKERDEEMVAVDRVATYVYLTNLLQYGPPFRLLVKKTETHADDETDDEEQSNGLREVVIEYGVGASKPELETLAWERLDANDDSEADEQFIDEDTSDRDADSEAGPFLHARLDNESQSSGASLRKLAERYQDMENASHSSSSDESDNSVVEIASVEEWSPKPVSKITRIVVVTDSEGEST